MESAFSHEYIPDVDWSHVRISPPVQMVLKVANTESSGLKYLRVFLSYKREALI